MRRLFAVGLLLSLLVAPMVHAEVITLPGEQQPDMRRWLLETDYQDFAGVGTISCLEDEGDVLTTATVVFDRKTVVTSAHWQWFYREGEAVPYHVEQIENCVFRLHSFEGEIIKTYRLVSQSLGTNTGRARITRRGDWAIIALDREVPHSITPIQMVDSRTVDLPALEQTYLVGFAGQDPFQDRATISTQCHLAQLRTTTNLLFEHVCDTSPGASGALIYFDLEGVPFGVAIHASGDGDPSSSLYNLAVATDEGIAYVAEMMGAGLLDCADLAGCPAHE